MGSEHVTTWAQGGGSDCVVAASKRPSNGVIPTLVIAPAAISCRLDAREYKGIVFYGHEPVAWCCLSSAEVPEFKAWATEQFSSLQIVTVAEPAPHLNCPPPAVPATDLPQQLTKQQEMREEMRNELRKLAPRWFVPAVPTDAMKQVA
jgi:hypothetical protein